jgi:hypothetical protein
VPARRGDPGDQRHVARRLFFYRVDAGHAGFGTPLRFPWVSRPPLQAILASSRSLK